MTTDQSTFWDILASKIREDAAPEAEETASLLESRAPKQLSRESPEQRWAEDIKSTLSSSSSREAQACLAEFAFIPWGKNPVAAQRKAVGNILLVAPVIAPDGLIESESYRMGLYYQRPNTYYQLHNHAAAETYYIIAGDAIWTAGNDTSRKQTGDIIHHPSYMPHAFEAGKNGLVAVWRWFGDIRRETYALLPDERAT